MNQEEIMLYETITRRCMEYYDGKINVFNTPVNYSINWLGNYDCYKSGITQLPNVVIFIPKPAVRILVDENDIKFCAMETVIHELFHSDQVIDFDRTIINLNYLNYIERAVELETAKYMYSHPTEVKHFTGIDISKSPNFMQYLQEQIWIKPFACYHRRDFYRHVAMCLGYLAIHEETIMDQIIQNMKLNRSGEKYNRLEWWVNDNIKLLIYDGAYTCPLDVFNAFIYNNYYHSNLEVLSKYDGTILKSYVWFSETMCRFDRRR